MTVLSDQPYGNANFRVEIDGIERSRFFEVQLPDLGLEIAEYREGTDPIEPNPRLVARPRLGTLILRRGFRGEKELYEWWQRNASGQTDQRNLSVILLNSEGTDVARWLMHRAIPVRLSYSPLDGLDGSPLLETLELTVESISME